LPAASGDYQMGLLSNWNMLGNPFSADVDFGNNMVITEGTEFDLDTSNQKLYTVNYAWGYDAATNSCKLVSGAFPFASPIIKTEQAVSFLSHVSSSPKLAWPSGALAVP